MNGRKEGFSYNDNGINVICLYGNWHEMGRQYGSLTKEMLAEVLAYIDQKLSGEEKRIASARETAEHLYANYPQRHKDFMQGVSETAGITLEEVKMCNALEYMEAAFFCSAMAVWDDYADGKLVMGRNYDALSYAELSRDIIVTVFHPDNQQAVAIVGYAGELYCVNGFNESGLFVELNNGMPSAGFDIHWELCPSTTRLLDMLFEARSMEDVERFFHETQSFSSITISVCDKHEARSYEWCYEGVRRGDVMTAEGLLVSTNHYVNDTWAFPTPSDEQSWCSLTRRCNLLAMAEAHRGRLDTEIMKRIISTPIADGGPRHEATRYQIVAVPEDMTLHIRLPHNEYWAEINLGKYFG